jgi:hypothetical protein
MKPATAATTAIGTVPASTAARTTTTPSSAAYPIAPKRSTGPGPRRSTRLPRIGAPSPSAIEYTATTTPAAP